MENLIQKAERLIKDIENSAKMTDGHIYTDSNNSNKYDELLNLNKSELINYFKSINKRDVDITDIANHLTNKGVSQEIVPGNIREYCRQWGVDVYVLDTDYLFTIYNKFDNVYLNPFNHSIAISNKVLRLNKSKFNGFDQTILVSNDANLKTENSLAGVILHELTHICMNVRPDIIAEFNSPFINLWKKFLIKTNTDNPILDSKYKFHSKYDDEILIEMEWLDNDGNETFCFEHIKPKIDWLILK